ncbi:MAG: LysM peptidoglycan-binding domain-containing protein [Oscillospiraceae bacterium]|nr:LysM peptidoglycan-binding domain-containing protein [Oscillospiraceae bacterium]
MWEIAVQQMRNGSKWKEIYVLNALTSTVIYLGQVLKIPK